MLSSNIHLTSIDGSIRRLVRSGHGIKVWNLLWLALLLAHTSLSHAQSPAASARELVKKGTVLMSMNKVDAAIESYNRAIELNPKYAAAYVNRGLAKRSKGDLAGSIEDYEKAVSIDSKSIAGNRFAAQAYTNRGYIKLNAMDVDDAIQDFTVAINIKPDEPDHYYKRGLAHLVKEDLGAALEDLNKSLSLSGSSPDKILMYASRGMVKLLQGRMVDAEKDFDEAIKLNDRKSFDLDHYLKSLEAQITLMRQHRVRQQKSIS